MIRYQKHYDRELSDERIRYWNDSRVCVANDHQPIQLIWCKMTDYYRLVCIRIAVLPTSVDTKWILISQAIHSNRLRK